MEQGPPGICWIVGEGLAGTQAQCQAVAAALGIASPVVKRVGLKRPWRWLSPPLVTLPAWAFSGDALAPPWPRLVLAAGRKAVAPALYIKRRSGAFTVFLQNPRVGPGRFDLVAAPAHDGLAGPNIVTTLGAPTRVNRAGLAEARARWAHLFADLPQPRIAALIGGGSRAYRMTEAGAAALGAQLAALPGALMLTPSRRTPHAALAALIAAARPAYAYDGGADNPYLGMLAWADHIVVTGDSASMLSDAASTGRPVHIAPLERRSARAARRLEALHAALIAHGAARPFAGPLGFWSYAPLDDARAVAAAIQQALGCGWTPGVA
jgi:uncharacterized protein